MISNLTTTVSCCINEMLHFQRDGEGFRKDGAFAAQQHPNPLQTQRALLCVVQENNAVVTLTGRQSFQQLVKPLHLSGFFVS